MRNKPRLVFMGTPEFAVPTLDALVAAGDYEIILVVTQPDRPAGRGRDPRPSPVKQAALGYGLPVWTPENLKGNENQARLRAAAPDVQVVVAYGEILRKAVLDIPPHGTLNVHASLLPRHRGAAPIHGALLAGDEETGVTIMLLDPGMDTGPILTQRSVPIAPSDTTATLHDTLAYLGATLLVETLPKWLSGAITATPQAHDEATVTRMLTKEDGRLDWQEGAAALARRVRAFDPWPGTFTIWQGQPLKILAAHPLDGPAGGARPGTVAIHDGSLAVATGDGWLALDALQLPGKRPQPAAHFINGYPDFVGSQVGEASP